jgi:DNA (cytosine-5)-methyltransferase 1
METRNDNKNIKVLNLYAGIGGNRKLWPNDKIEVTAIEYDPEIARLYKKHFPNDMVIITDAHKYLYEHYEEFDFIWSSPPCPTHSKMNNLTHVQEGKVVKYPDMRLYQEILLLKHFFKGKWVVENVISYYEPLIKPQIANNHYFWANFLIPNVKKDIRGIRSEGLYYKEKRNGFDLSDEKIPKRFKIKVLNNCVKPEVGRDVFNAAFNKKQTTLDNI